MVTALVPAKSSSKRIANKNLVNLNGVPLLAWTLDACKHWTAGGIPVIDKVVVATDHDGIAEYALKRGCEIYRLDERDTLDQRTVCQLWKEFCADKTGVQILLQPTNPFRQIWEMRNVWRLWESCQHETDIVISVQADHRVEMSEHGKPAWGWQDRIAVLSQDRKPRFMLDGAYYITTAEYIAQARFPEQGRVAMFSVSPMTAIDINTMDDLRLAQYVASGIGLDYWGASFQNPALPNTRPQVQNA